MNANLRNDDIGLCDLCGSEDGPRSPTQTAGGKAWACPTCRAPFPDNPPPQENPMTTTGRPFVVAPKTDADYANKTWGDRYGVDWCYPGDEDFITAPPVAPQPEEVEP